MNYIFYDLETTGRSAAWDQIIQVAALLTDDNLNIIDRYEEKCKINSSCIPNPEAILVNKIKIKTLLTTNLSHYQLMLNLQKKFFEWSPAIFIGYNSIKFDEEFIRNSFFKNLLDPYITIKKENYRFDLLDTVRATNYFYPEKLKSLISEKGNPILKLDKIAPINGISDFTAHDAMGDTIATLELAKIIKNKTNNIWKETISSKKQNYLLQYISENPFCYIDSFFGKMKIYFLAYVGEHPIYKWAICFDLRKDPEEIVNMSDEDLRKFLEKSPKVVKNIKLNKSPLFQTYKFINSSKAYEGISEEILLKRSHFINNSPLFKQRIIAYYEKKALEKEDDTNQSDIFAEESIYRKFFSKHDSELMVDFQQSSWEKKNIIKTKFKDERLTYFSNLLIYEENPESLEKTTLRKIRRNISQRLLSNNNENWLTLYDAYKKIDDLREKCDNENDYDSLNSLKEINEYLEIKEDKLLKYKD